MISDSENHCVDCIYQFLTCDVEPCVSCDSPSETGDYFYEYKNFKSAEIFYDKPVVVQKQDGVWYLGGLNINIFQAIKKIESDIGSYIKRIKLLNNYSQKFNGVSQAVKIIEEL